MIAEPTSITALRNASDRDEPTTVCTRSVSADSRDAVDAQVEKATAAGGKADPTPTQDYGFMYGRSFEDPDGHIWEVMWMDPTAIPAGDPAEASA